MLKYVLVIAALGSVPVLACDGEEHAGQTAQIGNVTVDQLAKKLVAAKKPAAPALVIFDANTDKTREEKGVIPTAILLPSSSDYDTALLPKGKADEVVFYCAATKCSASHTAAQRAVEAGYTNVKVLPEGITGWLKAGKATQKIKAAATAAPAAAAEPAQG